MLVEIIFVVVLSVHNPWHGFAGLTQYVSGRMGMGERRSDWGKGERRKVIGSEGRYRKWSGPKRRIVWEE